MSSKYQNEVEKYLCSVYQRVTKADNSKLN